MEKAAVNDEPSMEEILASIRKIISEQDDATEETAEAAVASPQADSTASDTDNTDVFDDDDILELTQIVEDDGNVIDLALLNAKSEPVQEDLEEVTSVTSDDDFMAMVESVVEDPADDVFAEIEESAVSAENSVEDNAEDLQGLDLLLEEPAAESDDTDVAAFSMEADTPDLVEDDVAAVEPPAPAAPVLSTETIVSAATTAAATAAFGKLASAMSQARKVPPADIVLGDGQKTLEQVVHDLLRPMMKDWLDTNLPDIVERLVQEEIRKMTGGDF